jgi:anti-sigma regulatory factor (Ser/Thr protein kinase)
MAGQGVRRDNAPRGAEDGDPGEPGDPALSTTVTLPGVERSVAIGRRFVRDTLGTRHPALEKVALSVSELATNAIMHTPSGDGGHLTIGIRAGGHVVRAEVTNDGTMATKPRVRRDAEAENGRGILLIEALADSWGVIEQSGTTTVWVEFRAGSWSLSGGPEH